MEEQQREAGQTHRLVEFVKLSISPVHSVGLGSAVIGRDLDAIALQPRQR